MNGLIGWNARAFLDWHEAKGLADKEATEKIAALTVESGALSAELADCKGTLEFCKNDRRQVGIGFGVGSRSSR